MCKYFQTGLVSEAHITQDTCVSVLLTSIDIRKASSIVFKLLHCCTMRRMAALSLVFDTSRGEQLNSVNNVQPPAGNRRF